MSHSTIRSGTHVEKIIIIAVTDFNLDFYTEVQDLSHLENALTTASPRFAALNMAICSVIEDFGLVGFETLAVEVRLTPHKLLSPGSHSAHRTRSPCCI